MNFPTPLRHLALIFICLCGTSVYAAEDSLEPNDTKDAAKTIDVGTTYNLSRLANNDDWFQFTAPPGLIRITMTQAAYSDTKNLILLLADANGNFKRTDFANSASETIVYHVDSLQTLKILVTGADQSFFDDYSLIVTRQKFNAGDDNSEENDNIDQASPLSLNATLTNRIAADDDWYSFTAANGYPLTVTLSYTAAQGNLDLEVYSTDGALVSRNTWAANGGAAASGQRSVTFSPAPGAGYRLAVVPFDGGSDYRGLAAQSYTIATAQTVITPDSRESDNTQVKAGSLTLPSTISGTCQDDDWFSLGTVDPGLIRVVLSYDSTVNGDLNVVLCNDQGAAIASNFSSNDEEIVYHVATPAPLWVKVFKAGAGDNSYTLNVSRERVSGADDAAEPDDRIEQSVPIALNATVSGRTAVDEDWFAISAANGYPLTVSVTYPQAQGNLDLEVHATDGSLVTRNTWVANGGAAAGNRSVTFSPSPGGAYRIAVIPFNGSASYLGSASLTYTIATSQTVISPDSRESDNTQITAKSLVVPSAISGTCQDDDWFSLGTVTPGMVSVTLNYDATVNGDLNAVICNAQGTQVASNFNSGDEEIVYHVSTPTDLWVKVFKAGAGDNSYSLSVARNRTSVGDDASENDDSLSSAKALPLATTVNGTAIDEDWYSFTPASTQTLTVTLGFPVAGPNLDLEVYDASAAILTRTILKNEGAATGSGRTASFVPAPGATYYLAVVPSNSVTASALTATPVSYTIKIDQTVVTEDAYEPNNILAKAIKIGLGTITAACLDDDWYAIDINEPGQLIVTLKHPALGASQDINLLLYDAQGTVIAGKNLTDQTEIARYHVLVPGTFYAKVFPTNVGGTNSYTLTVDRSTTTNGDDAVENNDVQSTATVLSDYNKLYGPYSAYDEDWYKFTMPQGTPSIEITYNNANEELELDAFTPTFGRVGYAYGTDGKTATGKSITVDLPSDDTVWVCIRGTLGTTYTLQVHHQTFQVIELPSGPAAMTPPTLYDLDGNGHKEILIGARKILDNNNKEITPGALYCLNSDGSIRWSKTFPAITGPDPVTNLTYSTTSPSTRAVVGDIDGDGKLDILVGVGGDIDPFMKSIPAGITHLTLKDPYEPGALGGMYCLNATDGTVKWFRSSLDTIGGPNNTGDGIPDGVISTPVIFDFDGDGVKEVSWGGFDQRVYVVNGKDGTNFNSGWPINVNDTEWSTPIIADLSNDGVPELMIGGDITENAAAGTQTGGVFHVWDRYGRDIQRGFNEFIGNSFFKGKFEEETIWSSPAVGDLDGDGKLEIAYGTGLFFNQSPDKGNYIRVWNSDGSLRAKLATIGKTFATPTIVDLNGDGAKKLVTTTYRGRVQAWNADGTSIFTTQTYQSGGVGLETPIYSSPVTVDLDGDGKMEIMYVQGHSLIVVNSTGVPLTDPKTVGMNVYFSRSTPAVGDVDGDGVLEVVVGGANADLTRGRVYLFHPSAKTNSNNRSGRLAYADNQTIPLTSAAQVRRDQVKAFVSRFYSEVLGRSPDAQGLADWTNRLLEGERDGGSVAQGFILSQEFIGKNVPDSPFLDILYKAFFNRDSDIGGKSNWMTQIQTGATRSQIVGGFVGSLEFSNLCGLYGITPAFTNTQGLRRGIVEELVRRFYISSLGRQPTDAELKAYTDDLMSGHRSASQIGRQMITGSEFIARNLTDSQYIDVMYRAFFGRTADPGGLDGWVKAIQNGTLTRSQILDSFLAGQEFINLAQSYGVLPSGGDPTQEELIQAFVTRFYQQCLQRSPDSGGLADWTNRLKTGVSTGADVGRGFALSLEFTNRNVTDSDFVDILYLAFFNRAGDPGGKSNWMNLIIGGTSRPQVLDGFLGSQEFFQLCEKYGIVPFKAAASSG